MCKQVLIDNQWYDVSYIQQDGPTDKFVIVYRDNGISRTTSLSSGWLRDKPVDKPIDTVDWTKPLQIKCGEKWHDVIFHKKYRDKIMLVYEDCGIPTTIYGYLNEVKIRNKPVVHKKTLYLILFDKSGEFLVFRDKQEREHAKLTIGPECYHFRDIDFEWEP